MSLAEIFLRIGCTLVGWMLAYGYCLMLAVVAELDCVALGPRFGRDALVFAGLSAVFVPLIPMGRRVAGLELIFKGFTLPLLALAPLAAAEVLPFFEAATLGNAHLCTVLAPASSDAPRPFWHPLWAPVHFAVLLGLVWAASRFWWPRQSAGSGDR